MDDGGAARSAEAVLDEVRLLERPKRVVVRQIEVACGDTYSLHFRNGNPGWSTAGMRPPPAANSAVRKRWTIPRSITDKKIRAYPST